MQKLADAVRKSSDPTLWTDEDLWDNAAVAWADYALRNMTGDLLAKALDVSRAMAEFRAELLARPGGQP